VLAQLTLSQLNRAPRCAGVKLVGAYRIPRIGQIPAVRGQ